MQTFHLNSLPKKKKKALRRAIASHYGAVQVQLQKGEKPFSHIWTMQLAHTAGMENVSKYIPQFLMLELLIEFKSQMGSFGFHQFAFGSSCKIPPLPLQKYLLPWTLWMQSSTYKLYIP
jgi:hypothetical protein